MQTHRQKHRLVGDDYSLGTCYSHISRASHEGRLQPCSRISSDTLSLDISVLRPDSPLSIRCPAGSLGLRTSTFGVFPRPAVVKLLSAGSIRLFVRLRFYSRQQSGLPAMPSESRSPTIDSLDQHPSFHLLEHRGHFSSRGILNPRPSTPSFPFLTHQANSRENIPRSRGSCHDSWRTRWISSYRPGWRNSHRSSGTRRDAFPDWTARTPHAPMCRCGPDTSLIPGITPALAIEGSATAPTMCPPYR